MILTRGEHVDTWTDVICVLSAFSDVGGTDGEHVPFFAGLTQQASLRIFLTDFDIKT